MLKNRSIIPTQPPYLQRSLTYPYFTKGSEKSNFKPGKGNIFHTHLIQHQFLDSCIIQIHWKLYTLTFLSFLNKISPLSRNVCAVTPYISGKEVSWFLHKRNRRTKEVFKFSVYKISFKLEWFIPGMERAFPLSQYSSKLLPEVTLKFINFSLLPKLQA